MAFPFDDTFWVTKQQADALRRFWRGGYLEVPDEERNPFLLLPYDLDRQRRGLTGVLLSPPGACRRTSITASCYSPEPFERLLKTAEELGVEADVRCPEPGYLIGWIESSQAHEVARKLMALRTGPDLSVDNRLFCERQRCRHRRQGDRLRAPLPAQGPGEAVGPR